MFQVGFHGQTKFQLFMFRVRFSGLCFNGLYRAFQAKMRVGLTWCVHSDLCKLNIIYFKTISYASKIIVSCF